MAERFPTRVNRYIALSVIPASAVVLIAAALDPHPSVTRPWLLYALLIIVAWAAEEYRVPTRHGASHTLTAAVHLPLILLFSPLEAMLLAALGTLASQLRRRRPLPRITYNIVMRVIAIGTPAIGLAFWRRHDHAFDGYRTFLNAGILQGIVHQAGPSIGATSHIWTYVYVSVVVAIGSALAALLYFALESALISAVVAIQMGSGVLTAWHNNMRVAMMPEATKSAIGIIAACVAAVNPVFVVFVILPVVVTHATTKAIFRLERETIDAVTALADAIDYRDPYTAQHSVRVADISRRLAQRLGLSREQVDEITLAARVHDLGKIGIPNDILLKNGKLTADEMATMQTHPRIGADVLQKYGNFHRALPFVLHHHERYDGKGYPHGLKGDEIPVGAQVVAHADAFDAMISDRPYRKGLRPDMALQRVSEATGSQFNPVVAGAFVAMVREDLIAAGLILPETGGSLAETAATKRSAGGEGKVRYLYGK